MSPEKIRVLRFISLINVPKGTYILLYVYNIKEFMVRLINERDLVRITAVTAVFVNVSIYILYYTVINKYTYDILYII